MADVSSKDDSRSFTSMIWLKLPPLAERRASQALSPELIEPLGRAPPRIPTIRDRAVQTAAKLVLEPIFEDNAYGYRPVPSAGRGHGQGSAPANPPGFTPTWSTPICPSKPHALLSARRVRASGGDLVEPRLFGQVHWTAADRRAVCCVSRFTEEHAASYRSEGCRMCGPETCF